MSCFWGAFGWVRLAGCVWIGVRLDENAFGLGCLDEDAFGLGRLDEDAFRLGVFHGLF